MRRTRWSAWRRGPRWPRSTLIPALLLLIALFALAGATHFWLLVRSFYLVGLLVGAAAVWALVQHSGLRGSWQDGSRRLMVGDPLVERLVLRNRMPWPKPLVEVQRSVRPGGDDGYRTVSVPGRGQTTLEYRTPALRRGRHLLAPALLRTWDPFGLFSRVSRHGEGRELLVLPRAELLPGFRPAAQRRGPGGRSRRPTPAPTPMAGGVRPYAPGDDRRLVHWPSSLRSGALMVKTFDADAGEIAGVVLDLRLDAEQRAEIVELAVAATASIVRTLLATGAPLSLVLVGEPRTHLSRIEGSGGLDRALEALALVSSVPESAAGSLRSISTRAGCVLITTRIAAAQRDAAALMAQGGGLTVVLVADAHDPCVPAARAAIESRGCAVYTVDPGTSLREALSPRGAAS